MNMQPALDELCAAVGADGGGAFFVADDDGVLHLAAMVGGGKAARFFHRLRNPDAPDGKTLVISLPGSSGSVLVLSRKGGKAFSQEDTTIARLYMRRLDESSVYIPSHARATGWTKQLEAIQRIA